MTPEASFSYVPAPAWTLHAPTRRDAVRYMAVAVAYVAAAKLGFRAAFVAEQVSPVWPAAGLSLWAVLRFGPSVAPAIWAGAFLANVTTHVPVLGAAGIAIGNTLEALVGAWLLRRFADVDRTIESLRQAVMLVAVAMSSTIVSATIGVAMLAATGLQPWARFGPLWWTWWLGDASGVLLLGPVLLTAPALAHLADHLARKVEFGALLAVALGVSLAAFTLGSPVLSGHRPLEYTVFPVVMWAALRFAHTGAALASITVSSVAVWGTLNGTGPFMAVGGSSANERVILLQIYNAVLATSGLVFGAAIADRNHADRLRTADHALTALLSQPLDLKQAAPRFLEAVCVTLGWEVGNLWCLDEERQRLVYVDSWQRDRSTQEFVTASAAREFASGIGLPGRVWASGRPVWIHDVVVDSNFPRLPVAARMGLHAGFGFPILTGTAVLGVMEFFTRVPRPVDSSLLALMTAAGSQVGQFIGERTARLEAESANRTKDQFLATVSRMHRQLRRH